MSGPVLALILGLLLLGAAAVLLWMARNGSGNPDGQGVTGDDAVASEVGGEGFEETPTEADWAEEPEDSAPVMNRHLGGVGRAIRKRRREWAPTRDLEYVREDGQIAYDWPDSLTSEFIESGRQEQQRNPLVLRDVVAGFYRGHELHIGDIGESTLLGVRRGGASPVNVHYAQGGGVPAGMRRVEALDQPPYFAMTSDVRALDRMVDVRLEESLGVLGLVVTDIAWARDWVVVRMSRRLDVAVWDDVLPHMVTLADVAMVLPPLNSAVPLDLSLGDRTRELPGEISTPVAPQSTSQPVAGTASTAQDRRGAHIQPVPTDSERADDAAAELEAQRKREELLEEKDTPAHAQAATHERPDITRPADPVDFPTRSHGRNLGDTTDLDGEFGGEEPFVHHIPPLGEDPEHTAGRYSGAQSRVFRTEQGSAGSTIFNDVEAPTAAADVWQAEVVDGPAAEELPSNVRSLREMRGRGSGRHRAASARHARKDDVEAGSREEDYETVEGEIVDPSDLE